MELEGHPTQDILEELQRRGALMYPGTEASPDTAALRMARQHAGEEPGVWLFLPAQAYETEIDDDPSL